MRTPAGRLAAGASSARPSVPTTPAKPWHADRADGVVDPEARLEKLVAPDRDQAADEADAARRRRRARWQPAVIATRPPIMPLMAFSG